MEKFKKAILELDPDIITGWNVINFDLNYLRNLFQKHKIPFDIGRTNESLRIRIESNFFRSSSADIPGRLVLDGLNFIKDPFIKEAPSIKNAEFESYTLEDVSQAIMGTGKILKGKGRHEEIEELYKTATENTLQKLSDYNLMDCELVYKILEKTDIVNLAVERSQLTGMPLDKIIGSIANFDSLYIREARKKGLVSPSTRFGDKEERITGGYVMNSEPGIYHNVIVLDFKSLYPSIIKTFNIDPASYLKKKEKGCIESPNSACFKNQEGILPIIIHKLHEAREKAKGEKRELSSYAIKTIMNSFFGVLASPNCRYFDMKMANAITNFGQMIIKLTAKEAETLGYKVFYSDSVSGDTEVIIKDKENNLSYQKINNLFKETKKIGLDNKEYDLPKNLKILTLDKNGRSVFKPIRYVMRHKTKKKMYRVWVTNLQYIDVTEDHSLIGYINKNKNNKLEVMGRLKELKPTEIKKDKNSIISLKKIPYNPKNQRAYPKEVYEFMGYFIGDGSFQRDQYAKDKNKDYYLRISAGIDKEEFIKRVINPLQDKTYLKHFWPSKTRNGDLTINGLKTTSLIGQEMRDEKGGKKVPRFLFDENEEAICSFLKGAFSADGTVMMRDNKPIVRFTNTDRQIIEDIRKLLFLVGVSNSHFIENKPNKYLGKVSKTFSKHIVIKDILKFKEKIGFLFERKQNRLNSLNYHHSKSTFYGLDFDLSRVKKIEEIKMPKYVYDLEIDETHRFFANGLLAHNTDSIFIDTKLSKEKAKALGKQIETHINKFYEKYVRENYNRKSFLELQFEKLYIAFMMPKTRGTEIGAKKRYAGLIEENGKEKLIITGLEAVRGDWTEAAQDFQKELLMKTFHEEDLIPFIKEYVKKLRSGKLDEKLIYRKSIRKNLAEYTKTTPPHVKAARKLPHLDSTIIQYYITTDGPEPIQQLRHKLDYEHYIKKQLQPIAKQILDLLGINFEDIAEGKQKTLF